MRKLILGGATLLALLAAAFTGCGSDLGGGIGTLCGDDDACKGNLMCRQYVCTKACESNVDCGSQNTCEGDYCYEVCRIKKDCSGYGAICQSGTCRNPSP